MDLLPGPDSTAMCTGLSLPLNLSQGYLIHLTHKADACERGIARQPGLSSNVCSPVDNATVFSQADGATSSSSSRCGAATAPDSDGARQAHDTGQPLASTLGSTYMACQGPGDLIVGATQQYNFSPESALDECGRIPDMHEAAAAAQDMLPGNVAGQLIHG